MKERKSRLRKLFGWGRIIVLVLIVVLPVRFFLLEPCHIASPAMETAVWKGDFVLVNKMPGLRTPKRNGVVLFTSPLRKDSTARNLFLSRCIGMPGDTLEMKSGRLWVNGREAPKSPDALARYAIDNSVRDVMLSQLRRLDIPLREPEATDSVYMLSLTPFEEYRIRGEVSSFINDRFRAAPTEEYKLVVPRKGRAYRLDAVALTACKEIILSEAGPAASIRDGKLFLDGRETTFFFFHRDYYWLLSDNTLDAVDSRHLGFVPEEAIVGNAWLIWLSKEPSSDGLHGYRWNRVFNKVR
ncbi:MAG: signal peptidase I [Parabacteroides sp.]|nr:signal peptidase I [Parabacteroides sp.]